MDVIISHTKKNYVLDILKRIFHEAFNLSMNINFFKLIINIALINFWFNGVYELLLLG